jgi:hypothetical protein
VPTVLLGIGIVVLTTVLAVAGVAIVRRRVAIQTLKAHHEVAGYILAIVGVVYAVLLAFVVVVTWQQFEDSRNAADEEASIVGVLYRDAFSLPGGGAEVRLALRSYAHSVVDDEWPEMAAHHRESRRTDAALDRVWIALRATRPRGQSEGLFYGEGVKRLLDASELRRKRILASSTELPAPVWAVLILGGLICIGFTYLFGVKSFLAQGLMVGSLAAITGLVLFLILSLDLPYTGDVGVGPSGMSDVIGEFSHYGG